MLPLCDRKCKQANVQSQAALTQARCIERNIYAVWEAQKLSLLRTRRRYRDCNLQHRRKVGNNASRSRRSETPVRTEDHSAQSLAQVALPLYEAQLCCTSVDIIGRRPSPGSHLLA